MLKEPGRSQYDWQFNFLGFPVRVAWGFWVVAAILGWSWSVSVDASFPNSPGGAPAVLLMWIAALLLSILVHEVGHTLAMKYYGLQSRIVLYHFGGLAIPDSFGSWNGARQRRIGPREQIVISAAGPGIQLALAALVWAIGMATGTYMELTGQLNWLFGTSLPIGEIPQTAIRYAAFNAIIYPSTIWAILNLAPILPLDGGHIMRSMLQLWNVDQPTHVAYMVSIGTGALLGIYCLQTGQPGGIMFLLFAASNWQAMQQGHGGF
ncbi:site-2 protease family protein [Aureliella helgolandensis]|uniref:Peptidase family M50 n=1 Tax=Aureliella helgolandensis TaxID=2527968 RepID=A0A518G2P8_9BACT|nr:site-2 protease family protein [Aureliella helgolandensis]QDV22819.1 Peptidase family M50 [Aureliella helgolandensis]